MTQWKDATRYTRSESRGVKPIDAWFVKSGKIGIWVGSRHLHNPGEWIFTCHQLDIDACPLGLPASAPAEEARARARALVGDAITELHNSFLKISEE